MDHFINSNISQLLHSFDGASIVICHHKMLNN